MLISIMAALVLSAASYENPTVGSTFEQTAMWGSMDHGIERLGQHSYAPESMGFLRPAPVGSGILLQFGGASVTVSGNVARPGLYAYTPGLTLSQAIGAAGMFVRGAGYDEILVRRHGSDGAYSTFLLSWNVSWHRNVQLEPGDEIIVPDSSLRPL